MPPRPRRDPETTPDSSRPGPLPGADADPAPSATPAPADAPTAVLRTDRDADRWAALTAPFPADEIELLPKPTARENRKGNCSECGGYHGLPAVHLSYVGHAGITMRLNDVDPMWSWEPVAYGPDGLPLIDSNGGLWLRLTVLGVTRLGYGDADGKRGAQATKEMIGDGIRNAAMRFGVATYLWSKSEKAAAMIAREGGEPVRADGPPPPPDTPPMTTADVVGAIEAAAVVMGKPMDELTEKLRAHQGGIPVEALDTLPLMVLVDFRRSLEPYVQQAMRDHPVT